MDLLRRHLTFANVLAATALVVALGTGSASAAKHWILGSSIKPRTVRGAQLAANSVDTLKVKNGSLRAVDFRKGQLPAGPQGPQGPAGATGPAGRSALSSLQSGETIHGTWAVSNPSATGLAMTGVTLPVPAPAPLDGKHVVVKGNDTVDGDGCTGTAEAPVAGPGFVCIYFAAASATVGASGISATQTSPFASSSEEPGSPHGFAVVVSGSANMYAYGTWVYTAP
jgi:hypothetical protein